MQPLERRASFGERCVLCVHSSVAPNMSCVQMHCDWLCTIVHAHTHNSPPSPADLKVRWWGQRSDRYDVETRMQPQPQGTAQGGEGGGGGGCANYMGRVPYS